jgi:HSP20 family protein
MTSTRITRRPVTAPFFRTPFFPASTLPNLAQAFEEMNARTNEMMQNVFAGFPAIETGEKFPMLNVSEAKDEFRVTAELPGMTTKDVTIDYLDGVLTIRGEKTKEETKEEEDRKYYMWERRYGTFQRALPFPGGISEDKITAEFKDGILTVHLPKAEEAKAKNRQIPINQQ